MCIRDRSTGESLQNMKAALLALRCCVPAGATLTASFVHAEAPRPNASISACVHDGSSRPKGSPISAEQIAEFHRIKAMLKGCTSFYEAMAADGVQWDFQNNQALPGRIWEEATPPELRPLVSRDLTPKELRAARKACNVNAPRDLERPRVLIVLGVAAAGKSTIVPQVEKLLDIKLEDYVAVEGDALREAHCGWQEAISEDSSRGYKDMFDKYLKKHTKNLKNDLLREALNNRQNVLWPMVGKDTTATMVLVKTMKEHGFAVDLVGLVVGHKEACARSVNRAHQIGRWNWSGLDAWDDTYKTLTTLSDPATGVDRVLVFDNHNFGQIKLLYARTSTIASLQEAIAARRPM
eukprot:TRINITY_DN12357_c0_g1_i1.p1 TRINITY_DN12357_c0_g1~~TRINITY_DN12357_c0_g1_i1.p1  ORF type:complete len:351 (-),score=90.18 TRINITY_DN12357_c0_g1_i1:141-1193(-)